MTRHGRRSHTVNEKAWTGWPHLTILTICFLSGVLIGFAFAYWGEQSGELCEYLRDYLELAARGRLELSFVSVLWDCVRWPLLAMAFSLTGLGIMAIPVLLLVRGFLLSYTATCFAVFFGVSGVCAAAALMTVTIILVLPVLFILSCEGFKASCGRIPGAAAGTECRCRAEVILPGAGISVVAAALQWTVVPLIFSAVCARFFI